ncbi:MAG: HAMP domain-containing histidine kinase [Candidatus Dormibacteraeota bacterium]|nr:HAMP domain-containing histidine kinase [Candidatus Dormibacteraeota bacterium]
MTRFLGTTRGRLVLFSVAILAVALLIADGAVIGSLYLAESTESDAVLVAQARVISATLENVNGNLSLDTADTPVETQAGIAVDAAVVATTGVLTQTPAQPLSAAALGSLAQRASTAQGPIWADLTDSRGVPRRAYAQPLNIGSEPSPVLVVSRSVGEIQSNQRRTLLVLVVVSAVLLVVGGTLAYWLAGRALRPVRTIAGLARSISEHDLHRRVDVKVPPDELGELVDTFNSMLSRLEASFDSLGRFTADASHELRAPLALMRSELDGALTQDRSRDEYKRVLVALQGEVDHLSRLSDQLLMLARADGGALVPSREPIDVADFMHETGARWEAVAERQGARIDVSAPASGVMEADPRLVRRVLDNLVDNAIRHAPVGTRVALHGYAVDGGWNLEVGDQGAGVPPERRADLFTRFGKSDAARTPDGAGAGLGLALSTAIARAHAGTLELVPDDGPGALFRLHLPGDSGRVDPR